MWARRTTQRRARKCDSAAPGGFRSGFTLIELLVVISIIALLIALLMPALRSAREAANQVACLSNLRQITIAINAYATDNDGRYPSSRGHGAYGPNDPWSMSWESMMLQDGYIPGEPFVASEVFHCPSDPLESAWTWGDRRSYLVNRGHWQWVYGWWAWATDAGGNSVIRTARLAGVKKPSHFFLLIESTYWGNSIFGYNVNVFADEGGQQSAHAMLRGEPLAGNFAFADGHAAWVDQQQVQDNRGYWSRSGVIEDLSTRW